VWTYWHWLAVLGLGFIVAERLWPRVTGQRLLRQGWLSDAAYLVFNSKYLGVLLGYVTMLWVGDLDQILGYRAAREWPRWAQFVALLVVVDFLKWSIHNLLHRVPWLWEFHKVHHSIVEMDWIGNWRFHWVEVLVYNTLLYVPASLLAVPSEGGLAVGVLDTFVGHFAHANLRWRIGWLKYVINCPEMHLWHHNHPDCGPVNRNFALTLTVWDWLFGTAYVPPHDPEKFGFDGIEQYPRELPGQWLAPFRAMLRK
jgi:sterol desaturase/sphingolipid hydroxylase (fatty acid hydroxylase superfamily)